jgi:proteasome lid subunit RPN8/RPN11
MLIIPQNLLDEMRADALERLPEEACGLLGGHGYSIEAGWRITNALHSPTAFAMDAREQVRAMLAIAADDLELVAIYHSHPYGPARPSPTDLARFAYPEVLYLIWAPAENSPLGELQVHAFSILKNRSREIFIKASITPGTFVLY